MSHESEIRLKNGTELAFVGDAVFELLVREHITRSIDTNAHTLHRMAVEYVCAQAQSRALEHILERLDDEEHDIVRRGRNANKTSAPKNASPRTYRYATALESLFGYLYLCGRRQRMQELFAVIVEFHEQDRKDYAQETALAYRQSDQIEN